MIPQSSNLTDCHLEQRNTNIQTTFLKEETNLEKCRILTLVPSYHIHTMTCSKQGTQTANCNSQSSTPCNPQLLQMLPKQRTTHTASWCPNIVLLYLSQKGTSDPKAKSLAIKVSKKDPWFEPKTTAAKKQQQTGSSRVWLAWSETFQSEVMPTVKCSLASKIKRPQHLSLFVYYEV